MSVDDEKLTSETIKENETGLTALEAERVRTPRDIAIEGMNLSDILSYYEPNVDLAMSIKQTSEEMRSSTMREI